MIKVRKSNIHGVGAFAEVKIPKDTEIVLGGIKRFKGFNHSCLPNLNRSIHDTSFTSNRDIEPGEELTVSYGLVKSVGCNCSECLDSRDHEIEETSQKILLVLASGPKRNRFLRDLVGIPFLYSSTMMYLVKNKLIQVKRDIVRLKEK